MFRSCPCTPRERLSEECKSQVGVFPLHADIARQLDGSKEIDKAVRRNNRHMDSALDGFTPLILVTRIKEELAELMRFVVREKFSFF